MARLVDLDAAREYLGKPSGDTGQDAEIDQLVTNASDAVIEWTGRDFVLETSATARTFDILPWDVTNRLIVIDDLSATPTAVKTIDAAGDDVTTYTVADDLVAYPLNRKSWQPITALRVRDAADGLSTNYQAVVTGIWGFPAVPDAVQQAVLSQVKFWFRRDLANVSQDDVYAPSDVGGPTGLAFEVKKLLMPYRKMGVR